MGELTIEKTGPGAEDGGEADSKGYGLACERGDGRLELLSATRASEAVEGHSASERFDGDDK